MNKFIFPVVLLLLIPSALAIETHDITYTVNDIVKVQHLLAGADESSVQLLVPEDAYNFDVVVDKKPAEFTLSRTDQHKQVVIPLSSGSHKVGVSYLTAAYLEKGRYSYFVGSLQTTQHTDTLSVYLTLPEGALLARPLTALNPPVNPLPVSVGTTGRQIMIKWLEEEVKPSDALSMFVIYEEKSGVLWYLVLAGSVIAAFAAVFYLYARHKKVVPMKKEAFSHLLEPEQRVVDALFKAKDHTMWQKELQIAVGFTKSKLSRAIRNMEQRGLVKKIPYGATNKIELITKGEPEETKEEE